MSKLLIILLLVNSFSLCYAEYDFIERTHYVRTEYNGVIVDDQSNPSPLSFNFDDGIVSGNNSTDLTPWFMFDKYNTYVETSSYGSDVDFDIQSSISATFKPLGNSFEIHTTLYDENWGCRSYVELTDLNDETTIFYADFFGGSADGLYPINPDHIYNLDISSRVILSEPDEYLFSLSEVYFAVIPEPCTVCLLAFGGLALRRSKFLDQKLRKQRRE